MKKIIYTCLFLLAGSQVKSQTSVTVSMGSGYANQVWYSLKNNVSTFQSRDSWDIQISDNAFSASIRVNSGAGAQLFDLLNADTLAWNSIDTSGMMAIYDRDTTWEESAFNYGNTGHPDYGWGYYTGGGNLFGKKIFVIKLVDGTYKKIWIKSLLVGNTYTIRMANLNGSNDTTFQLIKSDYAGKSFFYYDLRNMQVVDPEPPADDWDLTFTKYSAEVAPGVYYPVTGVLANFEVSVAEASGVDVNTVNYSDYPMQTDIATIGYDWKTFNMQTFQYEIEDSLVYWVLGRDSVIYRIEFTSFSGSSSGDFDFDVTVVNPTGINSFNQNINALDVYPNPVNQNATIMLMLSQAQSASMQLIAMDGRIMYQNQFDLTKGMNVIPFQRNNYAAGIYFLQIKAGKQVITKKILLN